MPSSLTVKTLQEYKTLIIANPTCVENFIIRFPFHELPEIHPIEVDLVSALCDVLGLFTKFGKLTRHLMSLLKFYYKNLKFPLTDDFCDFELLGKLLSVFLDALESAANVNIKYENWSLLQTLSYIAAYPNAPGDVIGRSVDVFCYYLGLSKHDDEDFNGSCTRIWEVVKSVESKHRTKLVYSFMRYLAPDEFSQMADVYCTVREFVRCMRQPAFHLDKSVLQCIIILYRKCTHIPTMKAISIKLIKTEFPTCVADRFSAEHFVEERKLLREIYYQLVNCIFDTAPWTSPQANLRDIIFGLETFPVQRNSDCYTEFDLLVFYLELMYNKKVRHYELNLIPHILRLYPNRKVPTNPAMFKVVFLLFAAYGKQEPSAEADELRFELLISLQQKGAEMPGYLSYHLAELFWVLRYGSRSLKCQVVAYWVKSEDAVLLGQLHNSLVNTPGLVDTLLDVIFNVMEVKVKRAVVNIFVWIGTKLKQQLATLLLRDGISLDTLTSVMEGNPLVTPICEPEDPQYNNMVDVMHRYFQNIMRYLTDEFPNISPSTRYRLLYVLQSVSWNLSTTKFATCIVLPRLVRMLVIDMQSKDIKMATNAYQFLTLIATVQVKFEHETVERIKLDPAPFLDDEQLVSNAVSMYLYILNPIYGQQRLIILQEGHLGLYHYVIDGLFRTGLANCYELVVQLLESREECVASMINITTIRTHCRELNTNAYFLKYLSLWCQLAEKLCYITIPARYLARYVKHLDRINYQDADYGLVRKYARTVLVV